MANFYPGILQLPFLLPFLTAGASDLNFASEWPFTARNGSDIVDPATVTFVMTSEELQELELKNEIVPTQYQHHEPLTPNLRTNEYYASSRRHSEHDLDPYFYYQMESKSDKSVTEDNSTSSENTDKQQGKLENADKQERKPEEKVANATVDEPKSTANEPRTPVTVSPKVGERPPLRGPLVSLLGPSVIGLRIRDDGRGDFFKDVQIAGNTEGLLFDGIRVKRQVSEFGSGSNSNQGDLPGPGVNRTLHAFAQINQNWWVARRFLDSPRILQNPVLRVSFILDPRGVTCPQLCFGHGTHKPTHGLLGICTPDYCECDLWNWKWRQLQCPFGYIFDPLKTTCSRPLTSSLCNGEAPAPAGAVIQAGPFHPHPHKHHLHKHKHPPSYHRGHGHGHRRQFENEIPLSSEAAKDF